MGPDDWKLREPFFESLTLRRDGDGLERAAAIEYGFDETFTNYARFWKFNVAPSSLRPQRRVGFRRGTNVAVRRLSQNSYSVLHNLVQAKRLEALVRNHEFGFHRSNIHCMLLFAGNALQLLTELQKTISHRVGPIVSGAALAVFPDWSTAWKDRYNNIKNYRTYLSHRGVMIACSRIIDGVRVPHVLSRSLLVSSEENPSVWMYADDGVDHQADDWVPYPRIAIETLSDTVSFCNDAYSHFCDVLEPYHATVEFQTACGWAEGMPPIL